MQVIFSATSVGVALFSLALTGGCSTGSRPVDPRIAAFGPHPYETIHAGRAIMLVDLLRTIRSGDENSAIQMMEDELDLHSASLLLGPEIEGSERRRLLSVIQHIKRYRSENPHEPSDPEVRESLEAVFQQLDQEAAP